ncbi:CopD family protein [Falsirhodobacter sp. alg1]|uniref:CopD family protein n=1 Tax=Falsirhodobacter sp. alg1 TaxID=1472418 RepID=UPI0005ED9B62|nr:CopD family protein [Falsirhodobacter sp. alg1]
MIVALKFLHLAAMLCWCAALIALPVLMTIYGDSRKQKPLQGSRQSRYAEFRLITHYGYVGFATPAAIIAVAAGTGLIFAAGVFDLWLVAKLALVAGMALVHAWLGHLVVSSAEERGLQRNFSPLFGLALVLPLILGVLWLVLAKPELGGITDYMPAIFLEPREQT